MIKRLEKRLDDLKVQQEIGQQRLPELQRQMDELRATLQRIAGAIQVIEETIAESKSSGIDDPTPAAVSPSDA